MAEVDIDVTQFMKRLDMADGHTREAVWEAMNDNRLDLEKEAKNLAPKDEGTLESSGVSTAPKWKWASETIETQVGFSTPYASKVHETMKPAISAEYQMEPGETTQDKPSTDYGEAGGKYLERPLIGKAKRYTKHIAAKVKKALK